MPRFLIVLISLISWGGMESPVFYPDFEGMHPDFQGMEGIYPNFEGMNLRGYGPRFRGFRGYGPLITNRPGNPQPRTPRPRPLVLSFLKIPDPPQESSFPHLACLGL